MLRRLTEMLVAFLLAFAAAMPVSARVMPMAMSTAGTVLQQSCPACLQSPPTDNIRPDRMLACTILTCAGPAVVQPDRGLVPVHAARWVAYVEAPAVRWAAAAPSPDPFPPKPIVLL